MPLPSSASSHAKQLLPTVLDERAKTNPNGIFAKVPRSATTYAEGFRSVTYSELVNGINRLAWLLDEFFGKGQGFPTITYLGPSDLRYSMIVVAAIKAGYKTFLPSPRNSKAAHLSLLSRLECTRLVATTPEVPCVSQIIEDYAVEKLAIPSLAELLDLKDVLSYPYEKTFNDAASDPIFILHTSGSTGIPKPLTYTNSFITGIATNTSLEPPKGFQILDRFFRTGSFFMTLPAFHVAGIGFSLIVPSFQSSVPVYPLPTVPPTTEGLIEATFNTEIDWAFVPPVVVAQLAGDPALLNVLSSKLKHLFYTGGSVPKSAGDVVAQKMGLYQCLGSSECATFPLIRPLSDQTCEDWSYVQIHPAIRHEFRHRFEDLHELVVVKSVDHEQHQPVFNHFPDTTEYETRDLFAPHPTKPDLWTHKSRIDDVIVFLNGEKTNPISFEHEITSHREVRAALVGGEQRLEACLIVELNESKRLSDDDQRQMLERLWPTIERANSVTPAHARVSKSKVLFTDPGTPFPRAGKGTVQRRATMDLYAKQIEELYAEPESDGPQALRVDFDFTNKDAVTEAVAESVKAVTKWAVCDADDEFFSLGMDSLQAMRLTRELKSKLGLSSLAIRNIYANPSVHLLTQEIVKVATRKQSTAADGENGDVEELESTLRTYEHRIDLIATALTSDVGHSAEPPRAVPHVYILTGSTGALGSFLLDRLLADPKVSHVYCFNRSADSAKLQHARSARAGLFTNVLGDRVSFLTVNLSKLDFGLESSILNTLSSTVTHVIHNAWPVDFNKTLHSFRASLDGVVNLAAFAARAKTSPSVLFISSISSVANYQNHPLVPEIVIRDPSAPSSMGYGQSKYLAERILDHAAQKLHVNVGTVRIGQICGTAQNPRGWNRNEWFPSLVLSSRFLGALPESLGSTAAECPWGTMGTIDWIPIDLLAGVIVELTEEVSKRETTNSLRVFHAVNPSSRPWSDLIPTVSECIRKAPSEGATDVRIVSFAEWLDLLQSHAQDTAISSAEVDGKAVRSNPGVKLLDFYDSLMRSDSSQNQSLAKLDIMQTLKVSKTLRTLDPVQPSQVNGWITHWVEEY